MKLKSILLVGFLGISALGSTGCAMPSDSSDKQATSELGTVEMDLQTTAASGNIFRLRSANFSITDASGVEVAQLHSEDFAPDAPIISIDLAAGQYTVTLLDGWYMQRDTGEMVNASVIGSTSRPVIIQTDVHSSLQYSFKVEGEAVTFGGTLDVSIRVGECHQDGFEPNNTQAEATVLNTVPVNASICGDDDWYTFAIGVAPGTLLAWTADFVHANGDIDMQLILPDGTTLSSAGVTNQERIEFAAQDGAYFLRILGFNGSVGDYTLSLQSVPTM